VVEHDLDVIAHADWVIDLGPGAGRDGGRVLFEGTPSALVRHPRSATARHLRRIVDDGAAGSAGTGAITEASR
jgi:excinuclease UvrABC ATPase subunit